MEENAGNVFFATKSSMKIRMKRKLAVVLLICISCHIGWAAQDLSGIGAEYEGGV